MEWDKDATELYKNVLRRTPLPIRKIASPLIRKAAEKRGYNAGSPTVTTTLLVEGIFDVVPHTFRARVVANLTSWGVDCRPYLENSPKPESTRTDLSQLMTSLRILANRFGITINEAECKKVLGTFSQYFQHSPVSFTVTTGTDIQPELTVHYLETSEPHTPDPLTMATVNQHIPVGSTSLIQLFEEINRSFDVLGYGVELNMTVGISEIWMALIPIDLPTLLSLKNLPPGVAKCTTIFKKYGFSRFPLIVFDLRRQLLHLHMIIKVPQSVAPQKYYDLITELGLASVPDEMATHIAQANIVCWTFSATGNSPESLSFSRLYDSKSEVPVEWSSTLHMCVEEPIFTNGHDRFIVGVSVSRNHTALKIENDYTGTMFEEIRKGARVGV